MNKVQAFMGLFTIALVGAMSFSSCSNDEGLPSYDNPNLSDTSGKNINLDLFISGELDGVPFTIFNGREYYVNASTSGEEGFCGTDITKFIQSHTTSYTRAATLQNSFYIDIKGCLSSDSLEESSRIDSVLVVGRYPFFPALKENRGVEIRYIDVDKTMWSTSFGKNKAAFSNFEISAVVDNTYDVFSEKIIFGKFNGYLYNGGGDSLHLKSGKFKGRIVQ